MHLTPDEGIFLVDQIEPLFKVDFFRTLTFTWREDDDDDHDDDDHEEEGMRKIENNKNFNFNYTSHPTFTQSLSQSG